MRSLNSDQEELKLILKELAGNLGHEKIRDLYHCRKLLLKKFNIKNFPIYLLYQISIFRLLGLEYSTLKEREIAQKEGIRITTVYNLKKEYRKRRNK